MGNRRALSLLLVLFAAAASHGVQYTVTERVYLDVSVGGAPAERVVVGLFGDAAPRTVRNFVALAVGGGGGATGVAGRTYVGTPFHRVIRRFMIQGGDVVNQDGTGSISLYGEMFDDESFAVKHSAPGFLSMANAGKNTNGCQFFITTVATPWLDGLHVAFGKVLEGMAVVHRVENVPTDSNDRPLKPVVITGAGRLPTPTPFTVTDDLYDIWEWIRGASVPVAFSFAILAMFHWMIKKLDVHVDEAPKRAPGVAATASAVDDTDRSADPNIAESTLRRRK